MLMMGPLDAIAPVLAALEMWGPVYQRWWDHPCRRGVAAEQPWSAAEQDRLGLLAGVDPGELATAADRLDRVAADVGDLGWEVGGAAAEVGIGPVASRLAAALGAALESEVAELTGLARQLRADSLRLELWLGEVVRQVLRAGDGAQTGGGHRSIWLAHREADEADGSMPCDARRGAPDVAESGEVARWRALDELVGSHSAVLAALRTALAAADGRGGAIDGWCGDPGGGSARSCASGIWVGEGAPSMRDVVVDRAYRDRVWQTWVPLPSTPAVVPGTGPLLAGTEGSRPETDTGVRIAQLPDGPVSGR
jgi:hypothetical protein